jgi:predicted Fe-Mo cluster-binding NifX family protein
MRFFSLAFVMAAGLVFNFSPCQQSAQRGDRSPASEEASAQTQEILVKFKATVPEDSVSALAATEGLQHVQDLKGIGVRVYRVPSGRNAQEVIKRLQADPKVEYAEPNYQYKIPEKQN